jgi:hypothetical protein
MAAVQTSEAGENLAPDNAGLGHFINRSPFNSTIFVKIYKYERGSLNSSTRALTEHNRSKQQHKIVDQQLLSESFCLTKLKSIHTAMVRNFEVMLTETLKQSAQDSASLCNVIH